MTFLRESEIYQSLIANFETYLGFTPGRIIKAIFRVTASAIRLLYVALEYLYWNIFATYADRSALRRMYEDWGLTWDSPTTDNARKTILNMYRQKGVGTKKWFADTVLFNFSEVTTATIEAGLRGLNTIDITVAYHSNPVPDDIVSDIQDYFTQDDKAVCGIDVLIKTLPEPQVAIE
jgi:uncharacterized phage protein gp47/JayE